MASSEVLFEMPSSRVFSEKSPPPYNRSKDDYTRWKTKFHLWREITEVAKTKQAALMVLRLDDVTQEDIMDLMTLNQIKEEGGADTLLEHLDKMFKNDDCVTAYELYEKFVSYQRQAELSVKEYCEEFQRRYYKVISSGSQISDHVLAHKLLKSANLSDRETLLMKATIGTMTYNNMLAQLKKVFNSGPAQMAAMKIKEEPDIEQSETFYGGSQRGSYGRRDYWSRGYDRISRQGQSVRKSENFRSDQQQTPKKRKGKNPLDNNGNISRCRICDSINHWEKKCPDRISAEYDTYHEERKQSDDSDRESLTWEIETHAANLCQEQYPDKPKVCVNFQPDADDENEAYNTRPDAESSTRPDAESNDVISRSDTETSDESSRSDAELKYGILQPDAEEIHAEANVDDGSDKVVNNEDKDYYESQDQLNSSSSSDDKVSGVECQDSEKPCHRSKNLTGTSNKICQKNSHHKEKKRLPNKRMRGKNELYWVRQKANKNVKLRTTDRSRQEHCGNFQRREPWKRRKTKYTSTMYMARS